jgi:hypothetical protein
VADQSGVRVRLALALLRRFAEHRLHDLVVAGQAELVAVYRGRRSSRARARASVVFPVAGIPFTRMTIRSPAALTGRA